MSATAEDARALGELNARIAAILDRHEYERLRETFAPDIHYVSIRREFHDADGVIADFRARTAPRVTRHTLGNAVFDVRDAHVATGWSVWTTFAAPAIDALPRVYMVADFADRYVRTEGGAWLVVERIITPVFRDAALAPGAPHPAPTTRVAEP